MLLVEGEGVATPARLEDAVAMAAQDVVRDLPELIFVFDQEDELALAFLGATDGTCTRGTSEGPLTRGR